MPNRHHIPNLLTYARMGAVPLCLAIMLVHPAWEATALFWIFVVASLTDFLDGHLAKWGVVSPMGALLDPIADKLLVALMLVYILVQPDQMLLCDYQSPEIYSLVLVKLFPVAAIVLRELYISGLREFLALRGLGLPVSRGGKWKTAIQMSAVACVLWGYTHLDLSYAEINMGNMRVNPCLDEEKPAEASVFVFVGGIILLYLAALLAVTSAISYTHSAIKHLR